MTCIVQRAPRPGSVFIVCLEPVTRRFLSGRDGGSQAGKVPETRDGGQNAQKHPLIGDGRNVGGRASNSRFRKRQGKSESTTAGLCDQSGSHLRLDCGDGPTDLPFVVGAPWSETSHPVHRFVISTWLFEHHPVTQHRLIDLASVKTNRDQLAIGDVDNQIAPVPVSFSSRWFEILANHQTDLSSSHPRSSFSHPAHRAAAGTPIEEHSISYPKLIPRIG